MDGQFAFLPWEGVDFTHTPEAGWEAYSFACSETQVGILIKGKYRSVSTVHYHLMPLSEKKKNVAKLKNLSLMKDIIPQ